MMWHMIWLESHHPTTITSSDQSHIIRLQSHHLTRVKSSDSSHIIECAMCVCGCLWVCGCVWTVACVCACIRVRIHVLCVCVYLSIFWCRCTVYPHLFCVCVCVCLCVYLSIRCTCIVCMRIYLGSDWHSTWCATVRQRDEPRDRRSVGPRLLLLVPAQTWGEPPRVCTETVNGFKARDPSGQHSPPFHS